MITLSLLNAADAADNGIRNNLQLIPAGNGFPVALTQEMRAVLREMPQGCQFEENYERLVRDYVLTHTDASLGDASKKSLVDQALLREYFDRYTVYFDGGENNLRALNAILTCCAKPENDVARHAILRLARLYGAGVLTASAPRSVVLETLRTHFGQWNQGGVITPAGYRDLMRFMDPNQAITQDDIRNFEQLFVEVLPDGAQTLRMLCKKI